MNPGLYRILYKRFRDFLQKKDIVMPIINVNGVNLYYEMVGQGFPLVFCHGYKGSHFEWALQVPAFLQDYKVIVMDHRGHCLSEAPSSKDDYSIPIFASDVRELLKLLGVKKCCLVGHSMGGFIALQFTVDYPEMVEALVLVDTAAKIERIAEYSPYMEAQRRIALDEGLEATFEYCVLHDPLTRETVEKYPYKREIMKQKLLNTSVEAYVYGIEAVAEWDGVVEHLSHISVPTMVITGQDDDVFLDLAKKMADAIPGARFHVIAGTGHSPQEDMPVVFNRYLRQFLKDVLG
jgi:pimeloyl-ACP methyl ester carboxylesterase